MELGALAASDQDDDRVSEFLGVTAVYARVENVISHRGEDCLEYQGKNRGSLQ